MKRSASLETPRAHGNVDHHKSRTVSSGFRKLFRTKSKSRSLHSFSSSSSLNAQIEIEYPKRPNPRICKSVSTFFTKYCRSCCSCCCCGNSATTDSPPLYDDQHDRSRRCWCCCRGTRRRAERISTSEPPKSSPPPPTALPSIRVRFAERVYDAVDIDRDLRRRERKLRFEAVAKEEFLVSSRDTTLMMEQEREGRDLQQEGGELSDSSSTATIEPVSNFFNS